MKSMFKILALLFVFALVPTNDMAAKNFHGTVTKVIDGDSMRIKTESGDYEVRLYGIDAPEYDQNYAQEAKMKVKRALYRKRVKVIPVEWDKYKRLVAIVEYSDDSSINELLLRNGLAWYYPKYCKKRICGSWKQVARKAREKKLNIWSENSPVAPWRWKQRKYK